jgi:hypothetical protein
MGYGKPVSRSYSPARIQGHGGVTSASPPHSFRGAPPRPATAHPVLGRSALSLDRSVGGGGRNSRDRDCATPIPRPRPWSAVGSASSAVEGLEAVLGHRDGGDVSSVVSHAAAVAKHARNHARRTAVRPQSAQPSLWGPRPQSAAARAAPGATSVRGERPHSAVHVRRSVLSRAVSPAGAHPSVFCVLCCVCLWREYAHSLKCRVRPSAIGWWTVVSTQYSESLRAVVRMGFGCVECTSRAAAVGANPQAAPALAP